MHALRGVSLDIAPGEILGLVGESGSGKSVLGFTHARAAARRRRVDGSVTVAGSDMVTGDAKALRKVRRLDLGAVFQDPMTSLNPTMRIGKQVAEAAGSDDEALRLLTAVGIPEPERRMRAYPHELSGGLRQRVMIAIAIAGNPELVIADEPTTALDVTVQAQVLRLLRDCATRSVAASCSSPTTSASRPRSRIASRCCTPAASPRSGRPQTFSTQPAHPYTLGLLRSRLTLDTARRPQARRAAGSVPSPVTPLPGCAFAPAVRCATRRVRQRLPDPLAIAPGRVSACIVPFETVSRRTRLAPDDRPPSAPRAGDCARRDAAVSRRAMRDQDVRRGSRPVGKLQALRGVSLTVADGESVALVGESGSGKSTLLRVIAGLEKPTPAAIELAGGQRPQMVFQDAGASLTPWLSVGELIGERLRRNGMSRAERQDAVAEALERVGLPPEVAKAQAGQLSGGQRQRVSLARAIVVPPSVLLCDEPTSALDVSLAASVLNLIGDLRRKLDMSVVFVTHDLAVARVVADRIAVMYLGRIVEIGPADEVIDDPAHPYTTALVDSVPDLGRESRVLPGEPASPLSPPTGCSFHPRCPIAIDTCADGQLDVRLEGAPGSPHQVACIERKVSWMAIALPARHAGAEPGPPAVAAEIPADAD